MLTMCVHSDSEFLRELGDRVKSIRIRKGMTHLDIAVLSKVNRTHLYKIENGELNCRVITLKKIADSLEVEMNKLF